MALDHNKAARKALKLIKKHGRSVTLIKDSAAPTDPNKPWEGPSPYNNTKATATAVFVEPVGTEDLSAQFGDTQRVQLTPETVQIAFVSAAEDTVADYDLETFDRVLDGDAVWQIQYVRVFQPGPVRILYQLALSR